MPPATSPTGLHWRTLTRQPWCRVKDGQYILEMMVAKQKGDPRAKWMKVSSAAWKEGGWATEAAALAARTQFKQWVDTGMNAKKRAAQAESAAARSPAGLASLSYALSAGGGHHWQVGSKLSIFQRQRYCLALNELIMGHCVAQRVSLSFTRKCGPKLTGFLTR